MFRAGVWSHQTFFAYWNDRCNWRLRFFRSVGIVEKYIFHCCAIDRPWISDDLWPGFRLWSSRQQKLQIALWLPDLHICPRADFHIYGYVQVWNQVKTGSGSLKRPALPLLRGVWAPLTVNPSFIAFKSVCMCARMCFIIQRSRNMAARVRRSRVSFRGAMQVSLGDNGRWEAGECLDGSKLYFVVLWWKRLSSLMQLL